MQYVTEGGTGVTGRDFVPASGALEFPPGTSTKTVSIRVRGDSLQEPDETFVVNLSSPVNATLSDGQGTGTIENDDPAR